MKKNGKYNRYIFLKKMNKGSLILIKGNKKYVSFGNDLKILKFINFNMLYKNSNLSYLDRYGINYIVLDNLDIVVDKVYNVNNYRKYLKLVYLKNILLKIGNI